MVLAKLNSPGTQKQIVQHLRGELVCVCIQFWTVFSTSIFAYCTGATNFCSAISTGGCRFFFGSNSKKKKI